MASKRDQAAWLAQLLAEQVGAPVTVAWEGEGVGRGDWWVRWTDGPATVTLQGHARSQAAFLRPLDVTGLRWGRAYSPQAWALALIGQVEAQPELTDWRELLGAAETWLDEADWPERPADAAHATRAEQLLAMAGDREAAIARDVLAGSPAAPASPAETKRSDETRCLMCGQPIPLRAGAGRPPRYCSPACRTRAWRRRTDTAETKPSDEIRCLTCGGPVAGRSGVGRPARYCSPACRTRAWRARTTNPAVTQIGDGNPAAAVHVRHAYEETA
jgi:hypothetical protein